MVLLPLCFALWWSARETLILPVFAAIESPLVRTVFAREQAQLQVLEDGRWKIKTALLSPPQADAKGARAVRVVYIDHLSPHVLGFPLLWAMLLALPYRRMRNMAAGTAALTAAAGVSLWLQIYYRMTLMMAAKEGPLWAQWPGVSTLSRVAVYPDWLPPLLKAAAQAAVYGAALVLPLLLVYVLNKPFLIGLLGASRK